MEKIFLAYDYFTSFKEYAGTLQPRRSGSVACLYGNRKTFTVTCNELGAIYPNPSNIDCGESVQERKIRDTTNEMVSSCKVCFGRGTKECQPVTNSDGVVQGYKCVCKEPFKVSILIIRSSDHINSDGNLLESIKSLYSRSLWKEWCMYKWIGRG